MKRNWWRSNLTNLIEILLTVKMLESLQVDMLVIYAYCLCYGPPQVIHHTSLKPKTNTKMETLTWSSTLMLSQAFLVLYYHYSSILSVEWDGHCGFPCSSPCLALEPSGFTNNIGFLLSGLHLPCSKRVNIHQEVLKRETIISAFSMRCFDGSL